MVIDYIFTNVCKNIKYYFIFYYILLTNMKNMLFNYEVLTYHVYVYS